MAGGQKINDHGSWVGTRGKNSVFPDGPHKVKAEKDDGHDGHLSDYEDTTEKIEAQQEMAKRKAKGHDRKPMHRN